MVKFFIPSFICLIFLAWGSGCALGSVTLPVPEPLSRSTLTPDQGFISPLATPGIEETHPAPSMRLSNLISNILSKPGDYTGQQVEILGYYRGWDLRKEAQGTPPVTRNDWVITDNSGAIYVTGNAPINLNPASQQDTTKVIRLVATVETNQNGVYLQAISVELVSAE